MWYKEQKKGECFPTTFSKGKESLFFVLHKNSLVVVVRRTRQKPQKISTDKKREKKEKLIPITSIESSSSHVVAEEKKTVVVVVVDRLKNRLDSRRPRGGAARDVARGKRRGEYCLSSLPPPRFFGVCARSFFFSFLFRRLWSDAMRERERLTKGVPIAGAR